MDWILDNAFLILVLVVCGAMHIFGHGHKHHDRQPNDRRKLVMLNWKTICWSLGLTLAFSFVLCVAWGLVMPEPTHMHEFLELVLPAFKWLTWWGFLLGLVESFLWGFYLGIVFVPIHNFFHRRWTTQ